MKRALFAIVLTATSAFGASTTQAATFIYHGTLQDSGKPAEGSYDIELTLYSASSGDGVIAGPLVMYGVPVHAGSFSAHADFGAGATTPDHGWLAVKVRNSGQENFAALSGRSAIAAATSTTVCPGAWDLNGNANNTSGTPTLPGTFLGTTDIYDPLILQSGGRQVAEFTSSSNTGAFADANNVVLGATNNSVGSSNIGATVAGGGTTGFTTCGLDGTHPCINAATGQFATVGGGVGNLASNADATVAGGNYGLATGTASFVAGGFANVASGEFSAVAGGDHNVASGWDALVAAGGTNTAGGDFSLAGGLHATIRDAAATPGCTPGANCGDYGTFVWSDATATALAPFSSTGPNQFLVNATGGVAINGAPASKNDELTIYGNGNGGKNVNVVMFPEGATLGYEFQVSGGSGSDPTFRVVQTDGVSTFTTRLMIGATNGFVGIVGGGNSYPFSVGIDTSNGDGANLTPGGVWTNGSSRTFKDDFAGIDVGGVLAKVLALPVQTWSYRNDHEEGRHMGPVAEDFAQAFGLGNNEKYIATSDEEGVALAAIQGLNQKLEKENADLRARLDQVLTRLDKLEANKQGE